MVYAAPFHRLVLIGNLYSDVWNTTLAMVPDGGGGTLPPVSDELLEAVATVVGSWFIETATGGVGIGISQRATLTSIKLNRIDTDGRYMDPDTMEHTYGTPPAGPVNVNPAPQLTLALTLRGPNERAHAGRGRMYFPPTGTVTSVGTDGRVSVADALQHSKGGLNLLSAVADAYLTESVGAVAGIASRTGAGAFQPVIQVSTGRVVDTMRSRRNKQLEDPQYWGTP